jgi:oxygen-independent coproporphyrinogen III oxidase
MDHFALRDDALARAKREGRLFRNFQGYTTRAGGDLLGLGASAIGQIGPTYSQNVKGLALYYEAIESGHYATERGLALSDDDRVRRSVIMALMCQGRVEFDTVQRLHGVPFASAFAAELQELAPWVDLGWVVLEPGAVQVTALGWYFVRSVAAVFDARLRNDPAARLTYSRIG